MKRGQFSVEFLTVFGFVFLMTIPLIVLFFDQSGLIQDSIASNQIRNIAIKITDKSETVYYLGEPSKITLKVHFPEHIEYVNISKRSVIFGYRTSSNSLQQIVSTARVNVTGSLSSSPGTHYIEIESMGGVVSITG